MGDEATKRSNLMTNLALVWVRQERPDVWQEIGRIAAEKYPPKKGGRRALPLPDSLAALKGKVTPNV